METIRTDSVKMGHIVINMAAAALLGGFHDVIDAWHVQVHDPVASGTDKMMMPRGVSVETFSSSVCGDLYNFAKICKESQVPVNGSQTDVWKFLPHIHIDGIGSGMIRPAGQERLDTFSLFASL